MSVVNDIKNSVIEISYSYYKDYGFKFFKPVLDLCMGYEGSGDAENDDTTFIAVVTPPDDEKSAYIITTKRANDRKSIEIQNVESLLTSKYSISHVKVLFAKPKEIHAILHDASAKSSKNESSENKKVHSAALQDLENIVTESVITGTSDIHFYVHEDRAEAVFRIDGLFSQRTPLGREQAISIIAAGLNTKSPDYRSVTDDQEMADVSIQMIVEIPDPTDPKKHVREKIELRTSKSGSLEGPHTVMRVIRTSQEAMKSIHDLNMDVDIKDMLIDATEAPTGIILLTGPTGSGKSTTLAGLYEIIDESRKIILLEDPVEYRIKRRNTVQKPVFPDVSGLGFIDYLKNALRQDPDIIGISEMRSKDVVDIVIKSALTGHLMVSTMHTNDAIGALTRLIDEGVSPQILAERNLFSAIAAQRLIPSLCSSCRVKKDVIQFEVAFVKSDNGCKYCNGTGVKGRVQISELIIFDDIGRGFIANNDLIGLEEHLKSNGWKSMTDRARMRVEQGVIDPFEAKKHISGLFEGEKSKNYPPVEFDNCNVTVS